MDPDIFSFSIEILFVRLKELFLDKMFSFVSNCRYLPTCSDYFIDCIKLNGPFKGSMLGLKRILRCHPIKFLGSDNGFDPAPDLSLKIKRVKK